MAYGPAVEFQDVSFALDNGLQIFSDLNLEIPAGQRCLLAGASRSGSSFFARIAMGLFRPDRGTVRVLGVDIAQSSLQTLHNLRLHIGFVFRDARLISNMSAGRNIALPLNYHRILRPSVVHERTEQLLQLFGLEPVQDLRPVALTPEQRMLTAFARSAILAPEVLFYDDPIVGFPPEVSARLLDAIGRVRKWIADTREDTQAPTMLIVVSEPGPYENFADRFGVFRDGKVFFDQQQYLDFKPSVKNT